ncbi:MAG: DUF1932 domain-containing protein [Candidatus Dormiibacterota bacterium]
MVTAAAPTVGLLHPGEMGAAVGAALLASGIPVLWVGQGRSKATRERADAAGLTDAGSLPELLRASSVVLSICPPEAAHGVAELVAANNFQGVYVDANAISPKSARMIEKLIRERGSAFVDAGIIGGPPGPEAAHLYLSGEGASAVALLFACADHLTTTVLEGPAGTASALKMCYAAWTKGSTALLLAALAAADALRVDQALLEEWKESQPELAMRLERTVQSAPRKAWRFVAEMEQIADTLEAAEVPGGFHRAAAEIYSRLARFRKHTTGPTLEELLRAVGDRDSKGTVKQKN